MTHHIRERENVVNWEISGAAPDIYVVILYIGWITFILHKHFTFLNLFTHLFQMSVHLNTFTQGRHRLQVFPFTSWIVKYSPWSCFDVSSCFFLLWTWRILGESTIGGFVLPIVLLFTVVLVYCCCFFFWSKVLFHWKRLRKLAA